MVIQEFERAFQAQGGSISGRQWSSVAERYGEEVDRFQQNFGWYDAFLINTNGDIIYTTTREQDIGKKCTLEQYCRHRLRKSLQPCKAIFPS